MINTSADVLNFSLAVGFIVLVVFLSILIFYAILILRDVSKVVDDVEDVTSKIRTTIVEPLKAVDFLVDRLKPYIDVVLEGRKKASKKRKSKKK